MKKHSKKVLLGAATLAALASVDQDVQAATAGVDVTARIIAPIAVNKVAALNFGTVTVAAATSGKVTVDNTGARTAAGGVTLVTGAGAEQEGQFNIKAATGVAYKVTVGPTAKLAAGTKKVTVTTFTLAGGAGAQTGLTNGAATKTYAFGGTLKIPGGQTPGTYKGTVTVTAAYQ